MSVVVVYCWLLSVGCQDLTLDRRASLLWLWIVCGGCRSVFPLSVPTSVSISDAFGDAKSIQVFEQENITVNQCVINTIALLFIVSMINKF